MTIPSSVMSIPLRLYVLTLAWGCGFGTAESPIEIQERERFIGAYVDIRIVSLRTRTTEIGDSVRDSILAIHDVTEDDLLNFVDTHGADVVFMRDLWNDIESRISERQEELGVVR